VQEGLDGRVGEPPVRVADAREPGASLAIHEQLAFGESHQLDNAARGLPDPNGPMRPRMNARDCEKRLIVGTLS